MPLHTNVGFAIFTHFTSTVTVGVCERVAYTVLEIRWMEK